MERRPGHRYVEKKGVPSDPDHLNDYIREYVNFLRREASVKNRFPVPVEAIYDHFGIRHDTETMDAERQGFKVSNSPLPYQIVLVNELDKLERRRFTLGHELVELLFEALSDGLMATPVDFECRGERKERHCERGAAELLMPQSAFQSLLGDRPVTVETASKLAEAFDASLLAALIRMVRLAPSPYLLIAWTKRLKPSQKKKKSPGQLSFAGMETEGPTEKLRATWYCRTRNVPIQHVPIHKSVPEDSVISRASEENRHIVGAERLSLGRTFEFRGEIEAFPLQLGSESWTFSLLSVPSTLRAR